MSVQNQGERDSVVDDSIFRKSALEKLSSPKQLDDYLRVNQPRGWLVALGFLVLLAAVGVWALRGTIPETASLRGIAFGTEEPARIVYGYAEARTAWRLKVGMEAQVSPDHAPRDEYGFIYGKVTRVGKRPATDAELSLTFGGKDLGREMLSGVRRPVLVEIELERPGGKPHWSNRAGAQVDFPGGSDCSILVVMRQRSLYELVFE